jgi:transcriptional regulator with GAF, ATPase, and Fis domain
VAATHRALEEMIVERQFRLDLYYRLNVFPISIPPLRERPEDIPLLVLHFVQQFARRMNKTIDAISSETMEALSRYTWPGNVRELQNVIERSVVVYQKGKLSVKQSWLPRECFPTEPATQPRFSRSEMEEREKIGTALAETRGRVSGPSGAAVKLGIPPSTLESKIRSMNINKYSFKAFRSTVTQERELVVAALAETGGRVSGLSGAAAELGLPRTTLESKIRSMSINKYSFQGFLAEALVPLENPSKVFTNCSPIHEEIATP